MLKTADPTDLNSPAGIAWNNQFKDQLMHRLVGILALSAGAGGALRAAVGSRYLFGRPEAELRHHVGPLAIHVPHPMLAPTKEDEEETPVPSIAAPQYKAAQDPATPPSIWEQWMHRQPGQEAIRPRGDLSTSSWETPWFMPGAVLGGTAAAMGGYKLVDWLLNSKRKAETEQDLQEAQHDYQKALIGQYDPAKLQHKAAAAPVDLLEQLADSYEKRAQGSLDPLLNYGLGTYATIAGGLLGLGGLAGYRYTKARGSTALLEKALKQRARERWAVRPPELEAIPVPVHVNRLGQPVADRLPKALDDDEEG